MAQNDKFATLDSVERELQTMGDWKAAVETSIQAGALASISGRSDLVIRYYAEAIANAGKHGLKYLELSARLARLQQLQAAGVSSGQTLDIVRTEIESDNLVKGPLVLRIREYASTALAACDRITSLLAGPEPPGAARLSEAVQAAAGEALAFALAVQSGSLEDWVREKCQNRLSIEALAELRTITEIVHSALEEQRDKLLAEAYTLSASLKAKLGDLDSSIDILCQAMQTTLSMPRARSSVQLALADAYLSRANFEKVDHPERSALDLAKAERAARRALTALDSIKIPALKAGRIAKLNEIRELRKSKALPVPLPGADRFYGAMAEVGRAQNALVEHRPEEALSFLRIALDQATGSQRGMALRLRAIAWYELQRYSEAVNDLDECIQIIGQESKGRESLGVLAGDRPLDLENLFLLKAFASAKVRKYAEAWNASEQGRSVMFRREILRLDSQSARQLEVVSFEALHSWLQAERAAFISFASTSWGTLAFFAGPEDKVPQAELVPFRAGEIAAKLDNPYLEESSKGWTQVIFDAVPLLSERLVRPIESRLRGITARARVLYVMPDSHLFRVPFSALILANGQPLADLCPLAISPSVAFALWCARHRTQRVQRKYLVVGVGGVPKSRPLIRFADQAKQIAAGLPSQIQAELILDEAATKTAIRTVAETADALHFSCHGSVSEKVFDPMSASQLEVADGVVTAEDVLHWKLNAELAFMNVCQSGRFRLEGRAEIQGFLRGFALAGVRSVVAPATHVDPKAASDLALAFYREWSGDTNKAEALQRAQQQIRRTHPDPRHWAAHSLVGDYLSGKEGERPT